MPLNRPYSEHVISWKDIDPLAISNIVPSGSGYLHVAPTGSYTAAEYTPLTHTIGPFMHYKRNTQPLKTNSDSTFFAEAKGY